MEVNLILTHWFRKYFDNNKAVTIEIDDSTNLKELIDSFGIDLDEIGFIQVNGHVKDYEYVIKEGDNIKIYPNIVGG